MQTTSPAATERHTWAVVDTETTGLYSQDRIVELAIVLVNGNGDVVDEWDTLLNPHRDVGPTDVHGINATMVAAAPTFEDVRRAVADRLDGAIIVAHNLQFDQRMLDGEFERSDGSWNPGRGFCTYQATGKKLAAACNDHDIRIELAHRALADARATAKLLSRLLGADMMPPAPSSVERSGRRSAPTLRREAFPDAPRWAQRETAVTQWSGALELDRYPRDEWGYLDLLDRALDDFWLSAEERVRLTELAQLAGIKASRLPDLHRQYVEDLYSLALRDDVITDEEFRQLDAVSDALGFRLGELHPDFERHRPPVASPSGAITRNCRVSFTGTAIDPITGQKLDRVALEELARDAGFEPQPSLTKAGTDLLVAQDANTQSGKAKKATQWGIPVMSVEQFVSQCRS